MMFTAVALISFVSCISEEVLWEVMPPDHQSLQHLTFLEVLHFEQGVEPKTGTTITTRRRMPSQAHLAVQGPGIVPSDFMSFMLPDALKSKYVDEATLGSGTFGVTFLAIRKADNQKVAVKVFKVDNDCATPATCRSEGCKNLINASASECLDTQRIHEADNLDSEASDHVVKCLDDGITGHTAGTQPFYILCSARRCGQMVREEAEAEPR